MVDGFVGHQVSLRVGDENDMTPVGSVLLYSLGESDRVDLRAVGAGDDRNHLTDALDEVVVGKPPVRGICHAVGHEGGERIGTLIAHNEATDEHGRAVSALLVRRWRLFAVRAVVEVVHRKRGRISQQRHSRDEDA